MAGVPDSELRKLTGFPAGIDNVNKEFEIPAQASRDGTVRAALRQAVNVNLDRFGKPSRREGYSRVISSSNVHSLWSHAELAFGFVVLNGVLTAIDTAYAQTAIRTGLSHIHPVSYATVNGVVFWSNRQTSGRITAALEDRPMALRSPAGQPTVSTSVNGGLRAGAYQVAITYATAAGEESGTSLAVVVDVAEGQGVQLSAIPQPLDAAVTVIRLYLSGADGDVLYYQRDIPVGMTSTILGVHFEGKPLETQWLQPLPPGQIVRHYNARLYIATGQMLRWSEAMRYGYHNPVRSFRRYPDEITLVAPAGEGTAGGLYVAAGSRTYWHAGADPKQSQQVVVYPHGAVAGTHCEVPAGLFGLDLKGNVAFWLATNGIPCVGLPSGQLMPLTENRYVTPIAERGASLVRERRGGNHIVMGLGGQQTNGIRASDSVVATVTRNGITV